MKAGNVVQRLDPSLHLLPGSRVVVRESATNNAISEEKGNIN
jgi:hypothetical protein